MNSLSKNILFNLFAESVYLLEYNFNNQLKFNPMKTKSELRAILFRHLDGIATAPVVFSLHKKGVLTFLLEHKKATLKQLVSHFKANEGYLNVALRVLASQG